MSTDQKSQSITSQTAVETRHLRRHDHPRGGEGLHHFCREHSTIPVITGGMGICHLFVDQDVDQEKAIEVIVNAKTQRPSVCNALDTLLIQEKIAASFLPELIRQLLERNVCFRLDSHTWEILRKMNRFSEKPLKKIGRRSG